MGYSSVQQSIFAFFQVQIVHIILDSCLDLISGFMKKIEWLHDESPGIYQKNTRTQRDKRGTVSQPIID